MVENSNESPNEVIKVGDDVLIIYDRRKRWIRKVESGKTFHCHKGSFSFDEIIGKPFGIKIKTSKSVNLTIHKPIVVDFLTQMSHSSQIIYPKDAAIILLYTDIKPGSKVIEVGTGSGALTVILASYVAPNGRVFTYEVRKNAYKTALKNITRLKLDKFVTMKLKNAKEGIEEKEVDAVILDMGEPWVLIPHAAKVLKTSGKIAIFLPTYNQVEKTLRALKEEGFDDIMGMELLSRELQLKEDAIRPMTWTVGHTGFLIFARLGNKKWKLKEDYDK